MGQERQATGFDFTDDLVIVVISAIVGAIVQNFLQPFPASVLISAAIFLVLLIIFRGLLKAWQEHPKREFRMRIFSLILGLSFGIAGMNVLEYITTRPDSVVSVCPSLPNKLPELELITEANARTIAAFPPRKNRDMRLFDVELTKDGRWLLVVTWQGLCFYGLPDLQPQFVPFQPEARSAVFSPNTRWLALGDKDGSVGVWEVIADGPRIQLQVRWKLQPYSAAITELAFSNDSWTLVSADSDGGLNQWNADKGNQISLIDEELADTTVRSMAFSPNGRFLVVAYDDGRLGTWDAGQVEISDFGDNPVAFISALAFGLDRQLASGSNDSTIMLWNLTTEGDLKEFRQLRGHTDSVLSIAFSPDGKLLASGSADQTIRLWSMETGEELQVLIGHTAEVNDLAFSADGKLLVSIGGDGKATLWGVSSR